MTLALLAATQPSPWPLLVSTIFVIVGWVALWAMGGDDDDD